MRVRDFNRVWNANYETFKRGIESADPGIAANVMMGMIKVTNFLLDQQIAAVEAGFREEW